MLAALGGASTHSLQESSTCVCSIYIAYRPIGARLHVKQLYSTLLLLVQRKYADCTVP